MGGTNLGGAHRRVPARAAAAARRDERIQPWKRSWSSGAPATRAWISTDVTASPPSGALKIVTGRGAPACSAPPDDGDRGSG